MPNKKEIIDSFFFSQQHSFLFRRDENVHVLLNALNLISMPNTIRLSGTLYIYTLSLYVLV